MAEIVKEAKFLESEARDRLVCLSSSYGSGIREQFVRIRPTGVIFHCLATERKPKKWALTAEEADAFCEAWQQYKADRAAALEAEGHRKLSVIAEARALAEPHGIKVMVVGDGLYEVRWPDGNLYFHGAVGVDRASAGVQELIQALAEPGENPFD